MAYQTDPPNETTHLLPRTRPRHLSIDVASIASHNSVISASESLLASTPIGERLAYNDYTTIDWLHDLVKDSYRRRTIHSSRGLRGRAKIIWDQIQGWVAAALIGTLTACVAFIVDLGVAGVSDLKTGYCANKWGWWRSREMCCLDRDPLQSGIGGLATTNLLGNSSLGIYGDMAEALRWPMSSGPRSVGALAETGATCDAWRPWTDSYYLGFGIYVLFALAFGIIAGAVTMTTRANLPAASPGKGGNFSSEQKKQTNGLVNGHDDSTTATPTVAGKSMYMAAGSGIPEIKTILSGFVIPHFLDFKVLLVKAVGSIFAVSTGMCLGKEGPFVHISTCVAYLVGIRFKKYRENSRKLREILSAGCAAGLSVAFGAPIGGVLFAYEEISTYFPRKVLWRAFICSLFAAMTLRALNPTGTGKLVLFETNYGTSYKPYHYLIFIILGIAGGIFGGLFCKINFWWSRHFRKFSIIKNHPVFEVFLVVAMTALTQYPNPLTREPGDVIIKNLLVDCRGDDAESSYVCIQELHHNSSGLSKSNSAYGTYLLYLTHGTLIKLILTIITFGIKVPSGIIIPALDSGAFFGRLLGQLPFLVNTISPGIFAMVSAASFLAGVSRMTISLAVIMFELTGELEFIVPNMIGIMVAKWVADWLEPEGVYDLAQTVLGHPFLDLDQSLNLVGSKARVAGELIPPSSTMSQIRVEVSPNGRVRAEVLARKLAQLKNRGLMDAGLVLVQKGFCVGYLAEGELEYGLNLLDESGAEDGAQVRVLTKVDEGRRGRVHTDDMEAGHAGPNSNGKDSTIVTYDQGEELDLSAFVDRTPLTINAQAPMEYVVEMFGKLGLRYLIVVEPETGKVAGVIIKKRLVAWVDGLKHEAEHKD